MPTVLELAGVNPRRFPLQGDSLVSLMHSEKMDFWNNRVLWSDEAMSYRTNDDPRVWGSLFFRDWHFLRSSKLVERGTEQPFPAIGFNFARDPREEDAYMPEHSNRFFLERIVSSMTELREANRRIWKAVTAEEDVIEQDPETQEQLRALGYIQ
jgi:hypothetical protein